VVCGIDLLFFQSELLPPEMRWIYELVGYGFAGKFAVNGAAFVLFALSGAAYTRARRHVRASVSKVRARDTRAPVLLLRSFGDDMTAIDVRDFKIPLFRQFPTFEETLTDHLWEFGPVVAIGRPGEPVPLLGAAREYVANEAWQARVAELTRTRTSFS